MLNLLLETSADTTAKTNTGSTWWIYVVLLVLVVLMLVLPSITNRKRMKEYDQMVNALHVGDTIRTVGGVIGRITKISDKDGVKTFILETGAKNNKTTMEFDIGSVGTVLKSTAKPEEKTEKVPAKAEENNKEVAGETAEKPAETAENAETVDAKETEKVEEAEKPVKAEKKAKSKKK